MSSVLALVLGTALVTVPKPCRVERPRPLVHGSRAGVRPLADVTLASSMGYPFLVHAPQAHATLAAEIRDAADMAWQAEIEEGIWPAPLPDDDGPDSMLDIYVDTTLGFDEAYVSPETYPLDRGLDVATCFMGLSPDFSDSDVLVSTVFHELNHTSQFALDAFEDDAFFEQTAVFVEATYVPELAAYGLGIDDYQQHPERALDYIGEDFYEYGSALWLLWYAKEMGGGDEAVLQLWLDSAQESFDGTNEPDYLDALAGSLGDYSAFFARFAIARWFTGSRDDGMHFADGADWGDGSLVPVERTVSCPFSASIGPFGAAYFEVLVDVAQPLRLRIEVFGPSAVAGIVQLGADEVFVADGSAPVEIVVAPATGNLLVALTRAPADYDPDDDDWTPIEVSATCAAIGLYPDAGPIDGSELTTDGGMTDVDPLDEERDGSCACTAAHRTSTGSARFLILLGWAAVARRRVRV
jgi:hypothetical protein